MVGRSLSNTVTGDRLERLPFILLMALALLSVCFILISDTASATEEEGNSFDFTLNVYYTGIIDDNDDFTVTGAYMKETGTMGYDRDLILCEWVKRASSGDRFVPVTEAYDGIKFHVTTVGDGSSRIYGDFENITFSESIKIINDHAFDGFIGTSIDLSGNIEQLGDYAFANCSEIRILTIPDNIDFIGEYCFYNCEKLEAVAIVGDLSLISPYMFGRCVSLDEVILNDEITEIGDYAFEECRSIVSIELPSKLTKIGIGLFSSCDSLAEADIPSSVMTLSEKTFYGCIGLRSINVSYGISTIAAEAFQNCDNLSDVILPETLLQIGEYSFSYCTSLKTIRLPESLKKIENYAFYGSGLESISLPDNVEKTGDNAFSKCDSMRGVAIGEGARVNLSSFQGRSFLNQNGIKMQSISSRTYYEYIESRTAYQLSGDVVKICWMNTANTGEITRYYDYILSGTVPSYTGPEPFKNMDVGYTYTFSGWIPEITEVYTNKTFTAQYVSVPRSYTVTWMNGDEVYSSKVCEYGSKIIPPTPNPTKPSTETSTFTFLRWNGYIDGLTVGGDTSFFAEYSEKKTVVDHEAEKKQQETNMQFIVIAAVSAILASAFLIFLYRRR